MTFIRYSNIDEKNIESKFRTSFFEQNYKNNWKKEELKSKGILQRAGADRIIIFQGIGPEVIAPIESGSFIIYLYNKNKKILYEVAYYMNFSPINMHYSERNRIYNFLMFQLYFVSLK
jgi:hypothetical protein